MSLDDLLAPLKVAKEYTWDVADEYILRQYTKVTKCWEEHVGNRYLLAAAMYLPLVPINYALTQGAFTPTPSTNSIQATLGIGFILAMAFDIPLTVAPIASRVMNRLRYNLNSDLADDFIEHIAKSFGRSFRLPLVGLTAGAVVHACGYFPDEHWLDAYAALGPILFSSMYIKDANEDILKKEPFWKKIYNWTRTPVQELA